MPHHLGPRPPHQLPQLPIILQPQPLLRAPACDHGALVVGGVKVDGDGPDVVQRRNEVVDGGVGGEGEDVGEVGRAGAFGFEGYEDLDLGGVFLAEERGGGEVEGVAGGEEGEGEGGGGCGCYLRGGG